MALADSVKPQVFTDFGDALNQAREILPEFAGAAQAGGVAVGNLITQLGEFGQSGDTQGFLNFVSGATNEDMKAFGNLIQGAATAVYGFAESLNGISTVAVNAAGGILSFGGQVLETVPWLGQWALAVGAAYVAAEKLPPMLSAIANSNFAQWLTQSSDGLSSLGAAYTVAASGAGVTSAALDAPGRRDAGRDGGSRPRCGRDRSARHRKAPRRARKPPRSAAPWPRSSVSSRPWTRNSRILRPNGSPGCGHGRGRC